MTMRMLRQLGALSSKRRTKICIKGAVSNFNSPYSTSSTDSRTMAVNKKRGTIVNKRGTFRAPRTTSSSHSAGPATSQAVAGPSNQAVAAPSTVPVVRPERKPVAAKTHDQRKSAAKLAASSSRGQIRRSNSPAISASSDPPFLLMKVGWVFIGNLPPAMTDVSLKRYFSACAGPVANVSIRYCGPPSPSHTTGTYRYAIVMFDGDPETAAASAYRALQQDGAIIPGDEKYQGFKIVVTDEPVGLPEVLEVAKGAGFNKNAQNVIFSGLPEHNVRQVPGIYTADGHTIAKPKPDEVWIKTRVWDPSKLTSVKTREQQRIDRRRERRDARWPGQGKGKGKAVEVDENANVDSNPGGQLVKFKPKPKPQQKAVCIGTQRFSFTPML
ncbi:hypothetical protein C8F01DRAFT_1365032 [Mycena amicta]|nr:hypothetical protein C8F01DRAFT_1365032 [Mycena amicta]